MAEPNAVTPSASSRSGGRTGRKALAAISAVGTQAAYRTQLICSRSTPRLRRKRRPMLASAPTEAPSMSRKPALPRTSENVPPRPDKGCSSEANPIGRMSASGYGWTARDSVSAAPPAMAAVTRMRQRLAADGSRPSGNSITSKTNAAREGPKMKVLSQYAVPVAGSEPGAVARP